MSDGCVSCDLSTRLDALPPRDRIASDEHWFVAHAFGVALLGWLVLVPRRHVTAVADLTDAEAAALGHWQVRLSQALHAARGCSKTYVAQFAEAEGFSHVHFHIVPRMPDLPEHLRGPGVFGLLGPDREPITSTKMDEFALTLRSLLQH